MQDDEVRRKILNDIASHVLNQHVDLVIVFKDPSSKETPGTAYDYACELLTLGLFIMNFKDAVREVDGEHVLLLWKFMLLGYWTKKLCSRSTNSSLTVLHIIT